MPIVNIVSLGSAACGPQGHFDADAEHRIASAVQCGPTLDLEPVNAYAGDMIWVQCREDAVALVNGDCTGTYIGSAGHADHLVLTAGHCVGMGDEALVAFNHEAEPDGSAYVGYGAVVEVAGVPDYALIELDEDPEITPAPLGWRPSQRLAVVQHPVGGPKVIAEGRLFEITEVQIRYADLDTLVGSSGAGVFNAIGQLVGVHSDGDCTVDGGTNNGWTLPAIVDASALLSNLELDD